MFKSIGKFLKVVLFTVFGAAVLLAVFYSAYILIFLSIIGILVGIGSIYANWDEIVIWANDD